MQLKVTVPTNSASCQETILTVAATNSRCLGHTIERHFMMKVDTHSPIVVINFDQSEDEGYYNGKNDKFLHSCCESSILTKLLTSVM